MAYAIANLIGLTIILCALRLYSDLSPYLSPENSQSELSYFNQDYIVLTKRLNALSVLGGKAAKFSPDEMRELKAQPWAQKVGDFKTAEYSVVGLVKMGGSELSSAMFLEAVPDEFIDHKPTGWEFNESRAFTGELPVIIPRDYLSLYNFGFAPSRGMPQLSDDIVTSIPITLILNGNGHHDVISARIAGFSDKLNTIAVPEGFISWSNRRYASGASGIGESEAESQPSRVIIATDKAGDPAVKEFIEAHGYHENGEATKHGKAAFFLSLLTAIIAGVGLVISGLAVMILVLSVFLLVQKNAEKIHQLMSLGYRPRTIGGYYFRLVVKVNALVFAGAVLLTLLASSWWGGITSSASLSEIAPGASPDKSIAGSLVPTALTAFALIALVTVLDYAIITRKIRGCFRIKK